MKRSNKRKTNTTTQPKRYTRPKMYKQIQYNPINKFTASAKKNEIKTLDGVFASTYATPYVVDQLIPNALTIDGTGCAQNVCSIQQGPGTGQRIGNRVALKSLRIRLQLLKSGTDHPEVSTARLMLVYDRQPNPTGAYPDIPAFLLQTTRQDNTNQTGSCFTNLSVNYMDRFVVLMDKILPLPPLVTDQIAITSLTGSTQSNVFIVDEFIKLKRLETVFNSTASPMTLAAVATGALYLVSLGNLAANAAPFCWRGSTRLRFYDN